MPALEPSDSRPGWACAWSPRTPPLAGLHPRRAPPGVGGIRGVRAGRLPAGAGDSRRATVERAGELGPRAAPRAAGSPRRSGVLAALALEPAVRADRPRPDTARAAGGLPAARAT